MRNPRAATAATVLVLIAAVITSGCSAGPAGPSTPSNRQMSSAVAKAGGLSVTLRSVPAVAPRGGTFALTLNVRNVSSKTLTYDLPNGQTYDFISFTKGGDEVWRWSKGMFFTQAISPFSLAPGDSQVFKVAWDTGTAAAGLYSIQGFFMGQPDLRPTVSVEISEEPSRTSAPAP